MSRLSSIMVSMNRLTTKQRAQVIACLVEGNSIRGTCRLTGYAKNTVTRLLVNLGRACSAYQDEGLCGLTLRRIECDEMWSFCGAKRANVPPEHENDPNYGDVWTWVALDSDTKIVPTWLVGDRSQADSRLFMDDLQGRIVGSVEVRTDKWMGYSEAVDWAFGPRADFAQRGNLRKRGTGKETTSLVERQNLTTRMGMRGMIRATNGFSRKAENLAAAVSLHFMWYNFARPHGTLGGKTPAQAAGVDQRRWTAEMIAGLLESN